MIRTRVRVVMAVAIAGLMGGNELGIMHPVRAQNHNPAAPKLTIKPNPVPLGQPFFVILRPLAPGEQVRFSIRPADASIDGWSLGTHRATAHGFIAFRAGPLTQTSQLGAWIVTARLPNRRTLTARMQVITPPTPAPVPTSPPLSPLRRWQIRLPTRTAASGAVAGNTIAVATKACLRCHVILSLIDLSSGRRQQVARLGWHVSPLTLQLSSRWLVWLQGNYPAVGWQIWAWDRATGRRRLVDSSASEGGVAAAGYPEISLWNNTLAWARHDCLQRCARPGPSTLRLVDLTGGTARVISHATYVCRQIDFPSLSRSVLSWVGTPLSGFGCPAPNTWTIVAQDRRSGHLSFHEIHLDRNQTADTFAGQGWRETWIEHLAVPKQENRLLLMNLRSGARRTITDHGYYSARLTDRVLAWIGDDGGSVEAMDLATGRHYLLAHEGGEGQRVRAIGIWLGQSWRSRVIWEEDSFNQNGGPIETAMMVGAVP